MSFSLADILFVLVIFQLLFTSGFLFANRRGRRISNRLLGILFLVIGLNLTDNLLLIKGAYSAHPELGLWSVWFLLLLGPLLFLYTQSILYRKYQFSLSRLWHFLPFLVLGLITEIYWLAIGRDGRHQMLLQIAARQTPAYQQWAPVLIFVQFFLYMFASYRLIGRFKRAAADTFSDYRRTDIRWLSNTLYFFTAIMTLAAANSLIGLTSFAGYWWPVFLVATGLVWVYVNVLLLRALSHSEIFAVVEEEDARERRAQWEADGERKGGWEGALSQIRGHMETQRPWLDPDLTLEQLAGQLKIRPKQLSQAINDGQNQNFFEFVNTYRIGEAKRLLTNPVDKKITVLEVLYEVGFNSKSSFNTVFKKQTGLTPSEFKKKMAGSEGVDESRTN